MEKRLLLLSLLRDHEMHGYQLSEMLSRNAGIPIKLTKPNAYKLLKKMEQEGWITYYEEQEGNRPPRRVYQITEAGEAAYQQMLRENLATYSTPEFPSAVAFNLISVLPAGEAVDLLRRRREIVAGCLHEVEETPLEMRVVHLSIDYLIRFYKTEIDWLDEMIARLSAT
ncbi:MAG: helix-turn-helix transcriptional regulator [Candidatus Promineifilaceae bacterium]|jgi:DNA-binding PadR family transcriptional regulator